MVFGAAPRKNKRNLLYLGVLLGHPHCYPRNVWGPLVTWGGGMTWKRAPRIRMSKELILFGLDPFETIDSIDVSKFLGLRVKDCLLCKKKQQKQWQKQRPTDFE